MTLIIPHVRYLLVVAMLAFSGTALAQTADMSVTLSDSPDPITLGTGNITYTATVTNHTASTANAPTLTLNIPASSTLLTMSATSGGNCNALGNTVTCTWALLSGPASRSASVTVTPTAGGTLTATASVAAAESDPAGANNNATTTTTVNQNIDLQVYSMSDSPDPITLGTGNVTYSTTIYNASTSKATNPVLTLTLPPASTFVSASATSSGTCSGTSSVVTCSWAGDFLSGNTRTVTLTVTPTAGGTATLTAAVDGDQPDVVTANDTGSHSTTVNANIDLQVYSMSDAPDPITLGAGNITYSTTIYNASSSKATNPVLTLTLPAASTFVSATATSGGTCSGTGSVVTCSWTGDLNSGNTRSVTLIVTPTAGGTATLTAAVDGDQPDVVTANNNGSHSTTVNASIDLQIYSMSDTPDPITLGTGNITYTTTIYNSSSSKATNPTLVLNLPAASTFVSATANLGGTCSGTSVVTCSWAGDFNSGNTRTATLIVTPTAGGTATLTASVDGDQPDGTPANDNGSHATTVNEFIDLQLYSMHDTPDPITLGTGNITYTTTIYNASSSKATNPVLTLTIPAASTFVSANANIGGTCSGTSVVTCTWAGDLTAGSTRTVTLVVTPTAGGTATLNASVDGDQPDNVSANDSASHNTTVNQFIDLQLYSMHDSPDPITLGTGNITYTTTIYNASTSKATNPVLTLTLPAASTYVSATASAGGTCTGTSVVTCSWSGDLASGNTRTVTLIVTPTAGGTATLSASVDGDQPDNVNANDSATHSTTVNEFIDLQLYSISDTPDPITLGTGNITYFVTIYNASSSKATNATVTLALPASSTFVSATANVAGTCTAPSGGVLTCSWAGDLTAGNTRQVTLIVTPTAGGTATVNATVDGDQPDNVNANDSATHNTTVNEFIDLQLYSISDTPDPITLGTGNVTYFVTIYNASSSKATNAATTITLPASATFVSASANVSGTCTAPSGGVLTCSWAGDLTAGNTRQATVIVTPTAGGTHTLSATVDGDQPDNVNANDSASQNTTVNASIELSLTMSDSPDPRVVGAGNVSYLLHAFNGSSSKATNPVVTFNVPANTTWVSSSPGSGGTCSLNAGVVSCSWPDISAGGSRSVTIVVTPTQVGQTSATANVTADQPDPNPANNSVTQTTNVNPSAPPVISGFTPASGPVGTSVTIAGSNFFSTTAVRFNGTSAAFTVTSNSSITASVPGGATTGVLTIVNASGTTNSTGTFTVTPAPDLAIAKTASSSTVPTSSAFSYSIAVSNVGAGAANDVTVTDVLPAGLTLDSVSGTGWTCSGSATIICTRGALASSGSAPVITINVTAPASGTTVTNTATVSTTTPDSGAANNTSSVSVGVVGCPSGAPILAPAAVCASSTGHTAFTPAVPGATYAWSITNGTITSATTSDTITFDAGTTGNVTLNVSVFVTSCPTQTNSVNVPISNPAATISASGATTFCQGGSVTLTANNGAGWAWSNGATTQAVTVSATDTLTVTVTDSAGCSATSAPATVTVNPLPNATITASGPTTFCDGGNVTLHAPAGMTSYSWSNGANTASIVVAESGSYAVSVTDPNGCSANSAPMTVTVLPPPAATITASGPATFCDGGSVTLTASNGSSWLWDTGAITQSITVSASGSHSVTVTDAGGCTATSAPFTVTELAPASVTISGPNTSCGSATLDAGAGWISYLWSTNETTQSITVTASGTYSVTVTDANGCQVTGSHVINVTPAPPVTITGPASTCATAPATLDAGPGYVSYLWSTGATTQAITASTSSTYTVTVTDANGCVGTGSHALTVFPTPNATITASGPTTFCDGGNVTLTAPAAAHYAWSNGEQTQSVTVNASGTFTVTVTDGNGCSATSAPVTVTVTPVASVTITGPTAVCSPAPATLDAGAGFASYLWNTGATSQTIGVTASGTYSVTVTNAGGCTATDAHDVTVTATPAATITANGPTAFCSGGSVTLTSAPAASYAWSNGATTQAITVTTGGTFTVTTNDGACSATSAPVTVTVNPAPVAAITAPGSVAANATISASVLGQPGDFTWTVGNGTLVSGQGTNAITFTAGASGVISVSVTVSNGTCSASDVRSITITGTPPAAADLGITKTAPQSVAPNGTIVYLLTISNHGPATASDVTVRDVLPNGVSFVSVNGGAWSCGNFHREIVCTGTLVSGASANVAITTTATQPSGSIVNTATVTAGTSDPNPLNDSAFAATQIVTSNDCPALAPVLTAPAQNATTASPVTFAWTAVPNATGYRLLIAVDGATPQELGTSIDARTVTTNVPPGAIVAYVEALFADCPATRSAGVSFHVPPLAPCGNRTPATPVAPAHDATVHSSSVEFIWTANDAAGGYRLWHSLDGAAPVVLTTTEATSYRTNVQPGLSEWWVEKLYEGCASTESQHFRFTIARQQNCGTDRPQALSPVGIRVSNAAVTFQWSAVADAAGYELWLSVDSGTPTLAGATTATSLDVTVPPGTLEWFVRALVDRCPSRDSQSATFVYAPSANCENTQRAAAVAPLPHAHVTSPADFAWTPAPNATRYELFLVRGNDTQLAATTTHTFANDVALPNGSTRWFVRTHFDGCAALDSAEEKLVVVPRPAACSELEAPVIAAAGQISSGVPFLIQWNEIAGATSYELQLASTPSFADAQLVATSDTKYELVRTTGDTPLGVYARVRALDARCQPTATVTAFGPSAAIFILPVTGTEGSAPLTGGEVVHVIQLGPELAGQTFTATVKEPWLRVSPATGTIAANGAKLTVVSDTSLLPLGTSVGAVTIALETASAGNVAAHATTITIPTVSISKVTPVTPTLKSTPPPDALIIPAVAHANGVNAQFQSDVRVTNSSAQLMQYQLSFTPTGDAGASLGKQTTFSIEPGRTIALDDILKSWFGTGNQSVTGTLEVRPVTQTSHAINGLSGLLNLSTFASSRTFNKTANGTFGQYIPAIPYANFIGNGRVLSLQQIAQSAQYRTNLGIVEGSGEAVSLLIKVFGNTGQPLTEFPLNLKGGEHTQLNAFLAAHGIDSLSDGRVEIQVTSPGGKVTAYASVLDNATSDPLLVTPVTLVDEGNTKWVMPGVADLDNGTANWQTDMRVFNAGTTDVDATLTYHSQNGGEPKTANVRIAAGAVQQLDRTLANTFGVSNDGGAIHIATPTAARLVTTARTYNQTSGGTYGQFLSAVTASEAAGVGSRPLQLLQVEESARFRSNIGLAEVTGQPVKVEITVVPPDAKFSAVTQLELGPNEFRQLNALLRSVGLTDTYNARVTVRAIEGPGRVTAYASVIDMITNDPTLVPAQ